MPTYGNTEGLTDRELAEIEAAELGYQAFLATCRPEDRAEMQRRHVVSLLADAGTDTPKTSALAKLVRELASVDADPATIGEPRTVDSLNESREAIDQRGGADKLGYSDTAVAVSQERPKPAEDTQHQQV
jgi:hypothetical protein